MIFYAEQTVETEVKATAHFTENPIYTSVQNLLYTGIAESRVEMRDVIMGR